MTRLISFLLIVGKVPLHYVNWTTTYYDLENKLEYILSKYTLEKTKGTTKNEQSKEIGSTEYKSQNKLTLEKTEVAIQFVQSRRTDNIWRKR
jgi:hypothetical protein